MPSIDLREVTKLSELLKIAAEGDDVVITDAGTPIARLVPIKQAKGVRRLGSMRGKIWIADDFDAPLPDDIQAAFEGK